ncbi:DUF932 domain-containing protein [Nocardia sp. NPDC052566]|uniref:DUF932 domain-containing protein n=1 Tax=Nocardia sp. NPDC052566 TaxID=3364330 RepID=UPI0037C50C5C
MTILETSRRTASTRRLGTDVSTAQCLDEALALAQLDWTIEEHPADNIIVMSNGRMIDTFMPGRRLFLRSDNHMTLNVGGGRYHPVDNRTAFAVADHAVAMGARFTVAGERKHGALAYLELDLPDANVKVGGKDLVTFQMVLKAAHDGQGKISGSANARRLECTNGMTANIGVPYVFEIGHTKKADEQLAEAKKLMQDAVQYARGFAAVAEHMLDTPMNRREFVAFIDGLYPEPDAADARKHGRWERRRDDMVSLFMFAQTNDFGRQTRWGAYSAITEWLDWGVTAKADHEVLAARQFDSTHQDTKNRALGLLMA